MNSVGGGYQYVWTGNGYRLVYVGGGSGNGYGYGNGYGSPYGQCKHTVHIIVSTHPYFHLFFIQSWVMIKILEVLR